MSNSYKTQCNIAFMGTGWAIVLEHDWAEADLPEIEQLLDTDELVYFINEHKIEVLNPDALGLEYQSKLWNLKSDIANTPKEMVLLPYLGLCIRAHNWTSHWPEKRGKYYVETYSGILEEDLALLPEENREDYKARFISLFVAWMHRKGNCISSFITGGSNFPVRRAERANRSEEKAYLIFEDFRKRYFKRLNRKARPGLDGELEEAMINLKKREEDQVQMKAINKIIKDKKKNPFDALVELGFTPAKAGLLLAPDFMGRIGFPGYALTNNNANIKRLRDRVDYLTKKVELRERNEDEPQDYPGGQYMVNRVEDRLQFTFEAKPAHEIICRFKKEGWNWSPRFKAWQRKITPNAFSSARQIYLMLKNLGNG